MTKEQKIALLIELYGEEGYKEMWNVYEFLFHDLQEKGWELPFDFSSVGEDYYCTYYCDKLGSIVCIDIDAPKRLESWGGLLAYFDSMEAEIQKVEKKIQ